MDSLQKLLGCLALAPAILLGFGVVNARNGRGRRGQKSVRIVVSDLLAYGVQVGFCGLLSAQLFYRQQQFASPVHQTDLMYAADVPDPAKVGRISIRDQAPGLPVVETFHDRFGASALEPHVQLHFLFGPRQTVLHADVRLLGRAFNRLAALAALLQDVKRRFVAAAARLRV